MPVVLTFLHLLILAHPASAQQGQATAAERVTALANAYMAGLFERRPEGATAYGLPDADHGAISNPSLMAASAWRTREDRWYEDLQAVDASRLQGHAEWVAFGFLREALEAGRQARVCRRELWSVDQMRGWQIVYPALAAIQPVGTSALREAALRRFGALPAYVDAHIEALREGLRQGYSAPRGTVERVLAQLDGLLETPPDASPFYSPARRDSTPAFREALASLITGAINPAVERYREFLRQEYILQARTKTAVSANPDGAACYRALIRQATSLDLSAEEIHRLGLEAMDTIQAEMRGIAVRTFATDDVSSLLDRLRTESSFLFTSRSEMRDEAEAAIERARGAMPAWFGKLPHTGVVVQPVPSYQEESASAGQYRPPAADGSRPGTFLVNLYKPEAQPRAQFESLVFHEAIPGHHVQIALAMERPDAHPITRYIGSTAFSEGWALYAERLADEMGLYSSDLDRLGMLSSLAFRAARLVVDTGLHALGWTRQMAIDYMAEHTMASLDEIVTEVDRYIVMPGQATSYMVGNLEIRRLQQEAERQLRERFDVAAFHDLVLGDGAVTLPMLREKVERWIASQR